MRMRSGLFFVVQGLALSVMSVHADGLVMVLPSGAADVERFAAEELHRYLKRIKYGNRVSRLIQPDLTLAEWMFEVVLDYDEGHYEELDLDPARSEAEQHRFVRASAGPDLPWDAAQRSWTIRPDR